MAVNILVASSDLDIYELVVDILEITFKKTKLDRARDYRRSVEMLSQPDARYNLILLDQGLDKDDERHVLTAMKNDCPQVADRIVLLSDASTPRPDMGILEGTSCIAKPFSLDEFGEIVKKACVSS
jgi:DNA-binding response OmpR family regulator